jgi:hypothetical protein
MRLSDTLGKAPHRHRIVVQCASLAERSPRAGRSAFHNRFATYSFLRQADAVLQGSATEPYCWTAPLVERDFFYDAPPGVAMI